MSDSLDRWNEMMIEREAQMERRHRPTYLETWIPGPEGYSSLSHLDLDTVWGDIFAHWERQVDTHVAVRIANAVEAILVEEARS